MFRMGIENSFTCEASLGGCSIGPYKGHHLNPQMYEMFGHDLCLSLLLFGRIKRVIPEKIAIGQIKRLLSTHGFTPSNSDSEDGSVSASPVTSEPNTPRKGSAKKTAGEP